MKITVTTLSDALFVLDVSEDLELENFKAFCEVEAGIPSSTMIISFNGRPLQNNLQTLKEYGIRDGDAVIVQQMQTSQSQTRKFNDPLAHYEPTQCILNRLSINFTFQGTEVFVFCAKWDEMQNSELNRLILLLVFSIYRHLHCFQSLSPFVGSRCCSW